MTTCMRCRQPIKDNNVYTRLRTGAAYCRGCYGRVPIGDCDLCGGPVIAWQGYREVFAPTHRLAHNHCIPTR